MKFRFHLFTGSCISVSVFYVVFVPEGGPRGPKLVVKNTDLIVLTVLWLFIVFVYAGGILVCQYVNLFRDPIYIVT